MKAFRKLLSLFLSLTLVLSTLPASAAPVVAQPPTQNEIKDFNQTFSDLEKTAEGLPKSAMAADRFLLMDQTVVPRSVPTVRTFVGHRWRTFKLGSLIRRSNKWIRWTRKNPAVIKDDAVPLADSEIERLASEHINSGRRIDTPLFIYERRGSVEQLTAIVKVLKNMRERWQGSQADSRADNRTEAPLETRVTSANWWDLDLFATVNELDTFESELLKGGSAYACRDAEGCTFKLVRNGKPLHLFGTKVKFLANLGPYIVFTHDDSFDSTTGVLNLMFMDLESYQGNLGNEEIPVFRLPLKIDSPMQTLEVRRDKLLINGKWFVEAGYLTQASEMQQVAFNLQANLVSPDTWAKILPLVDAVQEYFSKSVNSELKGKMNEKKNYQRAEVMMVDLGKQLQQQLQAQKALKPGVAIVPEDASKKMNANVVAYNENVQKSEALAKIIAGVQARSKISRQLSARVKLLGMNFISPRPYASQKIKNALAMFSVRGGKANTSTGWLDRILRLTDRPYMTAGAIGAGIMAAAAPSTFGQLLHLGLGVGTGVVDYVVFALRGMGEASVVGSQNTFQPFTDLASGEGAKTLSKQFVEKGNLYRTLVGIPVFMAFIYSLYFVPHFIFNIMAVRKDLKNPEIKSFRQRQTLFKKDYFDRLAKDEMVHRSEGEDVEFSPEEETRIMEWVASRERKPGIIRRTLSLPGKLIGAFTGFFSKQTDADDVPDLIEAASDSSVDEVVEMVQVSENSSSVSKAANDSPEDYMGFWTAVRHLAFSMPALELTLGRWAQIWNSWASWRFSSLGFAYINIGPTRVPWMIKVKPVTFATRLLFPEFLHTVVTRRTGQRVLPTELNGGTKSRSKYWAERAGAWRKDVTDQANVDPKKQLAALEEFEDQIIDAEQAVSEIALRSSLTALTKFMTNKKDRSLLFGEEAIGSITDRNLQRLSWSSQTFLRAHFESVYNKSMEAYLGQLVKEPEETEQTVAGASGVATEEDDQSPSVLEAKAALIRMHADEGDAAKYGFDIEQAKAAALATASDSSHVLFATSAVGKTRFAPSNIARNTKFGVITDFDPKQNRSMERFAVVAERLKSPSALGRAVRAEISKLLVTFPLDLTFKLVLTAGILHGAMAPIQPYLWGPNSTGYLSHMSFYYLFGSGFFMSMMADAWLKLQQDARQDNMGEFGQVPQGEDADRGFFRWYAKQFNAKENSIVKNWLYSNSLSFWNLPAALLNISAFGFLFSGRLDLSLLVAGYAMVFTTPISAFAMKIDQAFERAVHFAARGISDEKWLAHPKVQEMLVPEMQRLRNRYTLLNDLKGNFEGNLLGNVEMVPTSLGTRGYQRALFGGGLLEEYIVNNALNPLKAVSAKMGLGKIVTPIANACQWFLTNGNVDLKIKK